MSVKSGEPNSYGPRAKPQARRALDLGGEGGNDDVVDFVGSDGAHERGHVENGSGVGIPSDLYVSIGRTADDIGLHDVTGVVERLTGKRECVHTRTRACANRPRASSPP